MDVKVINKSKHALPAYETKASAGLDIRANVEKPIVLKPLERVLVKTGLFFEIPEGYEAQVRPRSGLALKKGITVLNAPGTIDACLLYTSPSPRDRTRSRMPSSA